MSKYLITIQVESETDPSDWYFGETLIIDEEYEVVSVKEI